MIQQSPVAKGRWWYAVRDDDDGGALFAEGVHAVEHFCWKERFHGEHFVDSRFSGSTSYGKPGGPPAGRVGAEGVSMNLDFGEPDDLAARPSVSGIAPSNAVVVHSPASW
jgi:hypothetical protein